MNFSKFTSTIIRTPEQNINFGKNIYMNKFNKLSNEEKQLVAGAESGSCVCGYQNELTRCFPVGDLTTCYQVCCVNFSYESWDFLGNSGTNLQGKCNQGSPAIKEFISQETPLAIFSKQSPDSKFC